MPASTFTTGFLAGYDDTERGNTQMDTAHIVSILTDLRQTIEVEAGASCLEVETSLAEALDDVCWALYLGPSQIREVLGAEVFHAVYSSVPITLPCVLGPCALRPWAEGPRAEAQDSVPQDQGPAAGPHAALRTQVRTAYAKSRNVTIYDQPDPAAAFQAAFCPERV